MPVEKLRLLPDVPLGEGVSDRVDGLRFSQYASILARAALDTPEPFTIGVYGGWGSGKTSMMYIMVNHWPPICFIISYVSFFRFIYIR